jgi:leucyl aminopeptidase
MAALGEMYTAIFSDNQNLINKLNKTSIATNDLTRQLPLDKDTKNAVKHNLADLSNT